MDHYVNHTCKCSSTVNIGRCILYKDSITKKFKIQLVWVQCKGTRKKKKHLPDEKKIKNNWMGIEIIEYVSANFV